MIGNYSGSAVKPSTQMILKRLGKSEINREIYLRQIPGIRREMKTILVIQKIPAVDIQAHSLS